MATHSKISVTIFQELYNVAMAYSKEGFHAVAGITLNIYLGVVALWWTYLILQYVRGKGDLDGIMSNFLTITGVSILLFAFKRNGFHVFYNAFYWPVDTLTNGIAEVLLTRMPNSGSGGSIIELLGILEHHIDKLMDFQKAMSGAVPWYNISAHILLFLVMIPYLFVWLIFLAYVINYIFKITAITVLGPIMTALFTFPFLRKYTYAMGQIVLSGALTVIFASVAMGFTLKLFHIYMALVPVSDTGDLKATDVTEFIFSSNFMALFAFGGVSVLFHLKAPVLARAISGVPDGPGAEAFVAGVGATMIASSKRIASRSSRRVLRAVGNKAQEMYNQRYRYEGSAANHIDPTKH